MPIHLQHDLYIDTITSIADAISITLIVGPTQEPHWRAIHRFLREPTDPPILHCPMMAPQPGSSPPTVRLTFMIKPIPPDTPLDQATTHCYMAWLDSYSSPQFEDAHTRTRNAFWAMLDAVADQFIGPDHHGIDDSQALSRFVATIGPQDT